MRNLNMYRWKRRRFWKRQISWLPCLLEVRISVPLFSDVYPMHFRFNNFWAVRSLNHFPFMCDVFTYFLFISCPESPSFPIHFSRQHLRWFVDLGPCSHDLCRAVGSWNLIGFSYQMNDLYNHKGTQYENMLHMLMYMLNTLWGPHVKTLENAWRCQG